MRVWKRHVDEDKYREGVTGSAETDEATDAVADNEHGSDAVDENSMLQVELPYTTGIWDNRIMYQCTRCPYSTLDLETMERHLLMHRAEDELRG